MKKFLSLVLTALMVFSMLPMSIFATDAVLPQASVEDLGSISVGGIDSGADYEVEQYYIYDLLGNQNQKLDTSDAFFRMQVAMEFVAKDSKEEAEANYYGDYTTDFFIELNGIEDGSFVADGCFLAGYYESYGAWVKIPLDGFTVENDAVYPVITAAGHDFSYADICGDVEAFKCGIYFTPEVLAANPELEVTLSLGLSENIDAALAAEFITVDSYTYDADEIGGLPNAQVANLGAVTVGTSAGVDFPVDSYYIYDLVGNQSLTSATEDFSVQIAMEFVANDSAKEAEKNFYGDYTTDFFVEINGLATDSFVADGCFLAGYYESYGLWVKIPLDGFTINDGAVYPVITAAGHDFSYVDICSDVENFVCGIYFTPEVLAANPDMDVTLYLGLSENIDEALACNFVSVDSYTYDVSDLAGYVVKVEKETVSEIIANHDDVAAEAVEEIVADIQTNAALEDFVPENLPEEIELVLTLVDMGVAVEETVVATTITYDVAPMQGGEKVTEFAEPITFRLPVPNSVTAPAAKVYHEDDLMGTFAVQTENGAKFVAVVSDTFSPYTVEFTDVLPVAEVNGVDYATLAEAVAAAQNGDTVVLLANAEIAGTVNVNKDITIDGNGYTVTQAAGASTSNHALIYMDGNANVTVKNATFDGVQGSVLRSVGANVTVDNCVFKNGTHTGHQGVVRLNIGNATVQNSKFIDNVGTMALSFNYDAGNATDTLVVDNCVFEGNVASETAIIYYADGDSCTITDSEFIDNTVNVNGNGATVYLGFTENNVVTGNLFDSNKVVSTGTSERAAGALFFGYEANVSGNVFVNNTATNAIGSALGQVCTSTYYDCTIDLGGNYWGGAAPVEGVDYTIQHKTGEAEFVLNSYYADAAMTNLVVLQAGITGSGTEADPYVIMTAEDMFLFAEKVNDGTYANDCYVVLGADIDLEEEDWTPITKFLGTFDGQGYTISNVWCVADGSAGFFGQLAEQTENVTGTVKNVTFENVTIIAGGQGTAGLIADARLGARVDNVKLIGEVTISGYRGVGGIVGAGFPVISNCTVEAEGTINASYWGAGAILGFANDSGAKAIDNTVIGVGEGLTVYGCLGGVGAITGTPYGAATNGATVKNVVISSTSDYYMGYVDASGSVTNVTVENTTVEVNGEAIVGNDAVAAIGTTPYFDFAEAVAAGGEVVLLKDVVLDDTLTIAAGKTVTLDLNGKTINGVDKINIAIMSYGDLTVKDSSAEQNGVIKAGKNSNKSGNVINVCAGTFTLESGNIYSVNNALLIDEQAATVTIKGGKITAEPNTRNSAVMYVSSPNDTVISIEGGEMVGYNGILLWNNTKIDMTAGSILAKGSLGIQGNGSKDNTEINISGGTIDGYYAAIYHPQGGELNISGDAVLSGYTGVVVKGGNVTISGGTISGTGAAAAYAPASSGFVDTGDGLYVECYDNSTNSENYGTPTVTVTGGTFTSVHAQAVASYANPNNNVEAPANFISGGTFSNPVPAEYCADGYAPVDLGDGTYGVSEATYVAEVNGVKYTTIADAFAAVQSGDTVTLLADATMEEEFVVDNMVLTIDGSAKLTLDDKLIVRGESTLNVSAALGNEVILGHGAIVKDSTINGPVFVAGNVTFRGDNTVTMLYDYGTLTDYYGTEAPMAWTVEAGASLTLTDKARYGLGYGDSVTVYGTLTDALTARETLTDADVSLFMHGLVAQESKGWNCDSSFVAKNAYIVIGSNNSFGNKPGNYGGTYVFEIENVVLDGSRITFYEALSSTTFTMKSSDVKIGTFMTNDADSTFILENTKLVSTATTNGTDESNKNAGALVLKNSSLTYNAAFTNNGAITLDVNSSLTAPQVLGAGTITVNAADFDGTTVQVVTADMSGFTGTVAVINNASALYEITENGIVIYAKPLSGKISYRAYVNDSASREAIQVDLENLCASESVVVKLYDANGNLLTTTSLKAGGVTAENYTANIVLWGNPSGSWDTTIETTLTADNMPETIELWVDGQLMDTFANALGAGTNVDETADYLALDCLATYVAEVNGVKYTTIAAAVAAAQAGDVVTVIADVSGEAVTVDKNLTVTGAVTLTDVSITGATGVELTVSGLTFAGNSWINSNGAAKLTVSGVTANVQPSNASATNSRSAFVALGRSEQAELVLVIENSNIVVKGGGDPVLGWAAITEATLSGNTFGASNAYQTNSDSVKFMSIADGAVFNVTNNTVYSNYNGIVFGQNTTRGNAYTVNLSGNTFYGGADHIWVEVSGSNTCHATIVADSTNTVNGNVFTAADIKLHPNLNTFTGYMGVGVDTDAEGKLVGGTYVKAPAADLIADGYECVDNGNGTYSVVEVVAGPVVTNFGARIYNKTFTAIGDEAADYVRVLLMSCIDKLAYDIQDWRDPTSLGIEVKVGDVTRIIYDDDSNIDFTVTAEGSKYTAPEGAYGFVSTMLALKKEDVQNTTYRAFVKGVDGNVYYSDWTELFTSPDGQYTVTEVGAATVDTDAAIVNSNSIDYRLPAISFYTGEKLTRTVLFASINAETDINWAWQKGITSKGFIITDADGNKTTIYNGDVAPGFSVTAGGRKYVPANGYYSLESCMVGFASDVDLTKCTFQLFVETTSGTVYSEATAIKY